LHREAILVKQFFPGQQKFQTSNLSISKPNILMKIINATTVILLVFPISAFSQKDINWKIYDHNFKQIAALKSPELSIHAGMIWYKSGKAFGVLDMKGNIFAPPVYQEIQHYPGGFTSVGTRGCFGMVYKGREILPLEYSRFFDVDTSGYFISRRGCSENKNSYIISNQTIYDTTGKLILEGSEEDINRTFNTLINRKQKVPDKEKFLSNGFSLKLIPGDSKFVKKGIYNKSDSLIFSCEKCRISDISDGLFIIYQTETNSNRIDGVYGVDSTGAIKVKNNYDELRYDRKHKRYLFTRANEYGYVTSAGVEHILMRSDYPTNVTPISKNRFLLTIRDSLQNNGLTICDSMGVYLVPVTKEWYQIAGDNCLVRKLKGGSQFIDSNGIPVSGLYDSVYAVPEFNYRIMVLEEAPGFYGVCEVDRISPLDRDGNSPDLAPLRTDAMITLRNGKKGFFNVRHNIEVAPQYSIVARVSENIFAVKADGRWFILNEKGRLGKIGKGTHINFFEKYIAVGN
jgi:hypothetical protein